MPVSIKVSQIKYKDSNGQYVGINAVAEQSTQEELSRIQTTGSQQISAIETKGTQTRASIPADYTALSDDVTDLKSTIDVTTEIGKNKYSGKFVNTSFVENDVYSSSFSYAGAAQTPINIQKQYTFSINGVPTYIRYVFLDANGNEIGSLANGSTTTMAPTNAKYLRWRTYDKLPSGYSNIQLEEGTNVTTYEPNTTAIDYFARASLMQKTKLTNDLINEITSEAGTYQEIPLDITSGSRYIVTPADIGQELSAPATSLSYYGSMVYIITEYPLKFRVSVRVNRQAIYHAIYVDANNIIIGGEIYYTDDEYHIVDNYDLTVPYNTAKIVLNGAAITAFSKFENDKLASMDYVSEYVDGYRQTVRAANIRSSNGAALSPVSFIDSFSSAMNGLRFTEELTPRVPITSQFSHGGEMVKISSGVFVLTPTNDVDTGDSPSSPNLYAVLAKVDEDSMEVTALYELAKYGDTDADGDTITSGVGTGPIRVLNGQIYCFLTAKTDQYYQYYTIFDPSTGTHTSLTKCKLNGSDFSSSRISELAEVTNNDGFVCLHGLIGNDNGTYYATVLLAGNVELKTGMIVSTTDMVNYTMFMIPDLGNDALSNFEVATCFFGGYIYISARQLNEDKQILAKISTGKEIIQQADIPDAQAKAVFFIVENALYLVHNVFDRMHVEIIRINTSRIDRSQSVMVSNSDNVYPFLYYENDVLYVVSTRNNTSKVYFSKTTMPTVNTTGIYDLLKTLNSYMET